MQRYRLLSLVVAAVWTVSGIAAFADSGCPKISSLIDFNCDKDLKIVFLGDSIVKGIGDSKRPIKGYPGRVQASLRAADVENLGIPGITSQALLANVKQSLTRKPNGATSTALHHADLIVVTVGVNDFFSNVDPGHTVRNISTLVKYLKSKLKSDDGTAPYVAVGTLIFSLRQFQQPFIRKLDDLLLKYNSTDTLPVLFRFDTVDVRKHATLSSDRLHPNGAGYDKMAKLALKVIRGVVQTLMGAQRTDNDADGIYDQLEPSFGTDPTKADTDGDGLTDGSEVFTYGTDPTKVDTDGNGIPDGQQVLTPTPTPTP